MELLKIEEYSNALKVFLRPTEAYPEGQNFSIVMCNLRML